MICQVCHKRGRNLSLIVGIRHPQVVYIDICKICGGPNSTDKYYDGFCGTCHSQLKYSSLAAEEGYPDHIIVYLRYGSRIKNIQTPHTILACSSCFRNIADLITEDKLCLVQEPENDLSITAISKTFGFIG